LLLVDDEWVNDTVVEEISKKYASTLTSFMLKRSKLFSDNALFELSHRCLNLKHLVLDFCPKITRASLMELAKRIQLETLQLYHNHNIDDKAIASIIRSSSSLRSLILDDCPKITNSACECLYGTQVAWGKKRNLDTQKISHFSCQVNSNLTDQSMCYLGNL
jgi:hypothetical protein